jgi:hypothetical protein
MRIEQINARSIRILELQGLDPITVVICNAGVGKGMLIIECYGRAWSAWWGAMDVDTVEQFVTDVATPDYITNCLVRGNRSVVTSTKAQAVDDRYVERIVAAVQRALRDEAAKVAA